MAPSASNGTSEGLSAPLLGHHVHGESAENVPEEVPPGIKILVDTPSALDTYQSGRCHWLQTTAALLTLQLGWGLWLFPSDFAHLGWYPAVGALVTLAALTAYSGHLFTRLYTKTPGAVLLGDIGAAAAGSLGRNLVYGIIYSLDATRCVILHLAATQSLRHIFPADSMPPLWQCGFAVLVLSAVLVQIRSLAELSWVFMTGTGAQLIAIGIVVYDLVTAPERDAHKVPSAITSETVLPALVALMNMIFAFGGQFAFVEIMSSMRNPSEFTRSVTVCTNIMAVLYGALGAVGYWSRGDSITGIVIFSLGDGIWSRVASALILVQATSQYLINLNVWCHNLLTLVARHQDAAAADSIKCSTDHCWKRWLFASVFVLAYSFGICISVPYFSTLVGLVTSVTYLSCAYALPAWFSLKLFPDALPTWEKVLLWLLIPSALIVSAAGLYASIWSLYEDINGGGEGGWGSAEGAPSLPTALMSMVGF